MTICSNERWFECNWALALDGGIMCICKNNCPFQKEEDFGE
jgi:hypothetical protein